MPSYPRPPFKKAALVLAISGTTLANASYAQTEEQSNEQDNYQLEEVIVTAQKRAESMQDVPISVATVTGAKLEKAGIENLEDLTSHLTNIHFTQTGFSTQIRVRGIGSDNSQGFEQSVGMYVDGIYHGRAQLYRAPMMDMASVELLRGPQGTLLGKNSVAGALNLTTARPTDEFGGYVSLSHEFEYGGNEINGVINGALSDTVNARLAIRALKEDGYVYNEYKQRDEPQTEENALRLSVDWQVNDDFKLLMKYEKNEFDTLGRSIEITKDDNLMEGGANYSTMLQTLFGQPGFDSELDRVRATNTDEHSYNTIDNLTLTGDYMLGRYALTFVSGWLEYAYDEMCDCDFISAESVPVQLNESYGQFSQEIRIASPGGEKVDWIAGLFYQRYDQEFSDILDIVTPQNLLPYVPGNSGLADTTNVREFQQDSENVAAFGQATWSITDTLSITAGGRITQENKSAEKTIWLRRPSTGEEITNPDIGALYWGTFKTETEALYNVDPVTGDYTTKEGHQANGERDETKFLPLVNLVYQPDDNLMTYVRYTKGYKAGGFDPRSNTVGGTIESTEEVPELRHFEFDSEDANSYEIGGKTRFFNGRSELNLALYYTEYDNLQISQFDGGVGFNVGNAKETITQGIEIEGRSLVTSNLVATYGLSYLDFEYKDFQNGNCYVGQAPDGIDTSGDGNVDSCDYTGKRGAYTPEYTVNLGLEYINNISQDIEIFTSIDAQWIDEHDVHVNLDPEGMQAAYTMVGASIGFEAEEWRIALRGNNLLDEDIVSYTGNVPLSSNFGTNTHYSFIRAPRMVSLDLKINF